MIKSKEFILENGEELRNELTEWMLKHIKVKKERIPFFNHKFGGNYKVNIKIEELYLNNGKRKTKISN